MTGDPMAFETPQDELQHDEGELHVLIVDDNPSDLYLAQEAIAPLREGHIHHTEVGSFDAALAALESQHFDICLCDFRLDSGRTGLDFYLTARSHGYDMPFIAMTGAMNELVAAETLITAGFDDVVDKSHLLQTNFERILRNACLRHRHNRHLLENANTDELTHVLNRRGLFQRLESESKTAARTGEPLAVTYFDLNEFKRINDDWGHPMGDKYLRLFATLLKDSCRDVDFVGRMGGDEFVIGMPRTSFDGAELVVQRLHKLIAGRTTTVAPCPIPLTFSVGRAVSTREQPLTVEALLAAADKAMYEHKQAQRRAR